MASSSKNDSGSDSDTSSGDGDTSCGDDDNSNGDGDNSSGNADNSGGDTAPYDSCLFSVDERVLAYDGPLIYDAKVLKVEYRENGWSCFVHYIGWNKRQDKWVGTDQVMKHTEENVIKQKALQKELGADKKSKFGRSARTKPQSSTVAKENKEDVKHNVAKGKKCKGDSSIEKNDLPAGKLVEIQIPSTLKKQLVHDWEFVNQQNKLVKLPRSPNIDDILTKYQEHMSGKDCMTDSVGEILNGMRSYFEKSLPVILLYKKERPQFCDVTENGISPSTIYGAEHLLRLFVKLPELLTYVNIEEEALTSMQQILLDFLKFLEENQSIFFLSAYDGSKTSEGKGKGKDD